KWSLPGSLASSLTLWLSARRDHRPPGLRWEASGPSAASEQGQGGEGGEAQEGDRGRHGGGRLAGADRLDGRGRRRRRRRGAHRRVRGGAAGAGPRIRDVRRRWPRGGGRARGGRTRGRRRPRGRRREGEWRQGADDRARGDGAILVLVAGAI